MTVLQIDSLTSLTKNQGFLDNFFWPLILAIVVFVGGLIWNLFIRKKLIISVNDASTYIGQHNNGGRTYIIVNLSLINKTENGINNLTLSVDPILPIKNGVFSPTASGKIPGGGILIPTLINLIDNVIFTSPMNIIASNTVVGNIILELGTSLPSSVKLRFNILTKRL